MEKRAALFVLSVICLEVAFVFDAVDAKGMGKGLGRGRHSWMHGR